MNKIYKVVWSKVKHCYVVTSELAKRNGKGCGARSLRMAAVSMGVAAALLGGVGATVAEAATTITGTVEKGGVSKSITEANFYIDGYQRDWGAANEAFEGTTGSSLLNPATGYTTVITAANWRLFRNANLPEGTVSGNTLTLKGDSISISQSVVGGEIYGDSSKSEGVKGTVTDNHVIIESGTYKGTVYGGSLQGGYGATVDGDVTLNTVTINGGTVGAVYGGYGPNKTNSNVVTVSSGTIGSSAEQNAVVGANNYGFGNDPIATLNKVTVNGNAKVTGGVIGARDGYGTAVITDNTVTIDGSAVVSGNIAGGYGWDKDNTKNKVYIKSGSVTGDVYGATQYSNYNNNYTGNADSNEVYISGGKVTGNVYGGSLEGKVTGEVKGNKVEITGGEVTKEVHGGLSSSANASNIDHNSVSISNDAIVGNNVYGGKIDWDKSGTVTNNSVTMSGGTVGGLYGGYSRQAHGTGAVSGNTVEMKGGKLSGYGYIVGGYSTENYTTDNPTKVDVINNVVKITGDVDFKTSVVGGWAQGSGLVQNNRVEFSANNVDHDGEGEFSASVKGGHGGSGGATDNKVVFSKGTVNSVIGGLASKEVQRNSVEMSGGTVYGEITGGSGGSGTVDNNEVNISNGTVGKSASADSKTEVSGGYSSLGAVGFPSYPTMSASGIVSQNAVTISNGTYFGELGIRGGYMGASASAIAEDTTATVTGTIDSNAVTVSGGTYSGKVNIYGGYGNAIARGSGTATATATVAVTNNTATISGGTFSENVNVYGGYGGSSTEGDGTLDVSVTVEKNKVIFSGSKVTGNVYGGYNDSGNVTGDANSNKVEMTGGTVTGDVMGGYSETGNAKSNTVTVSGNAVTGSVYGGITYIGGDVTGNTVTISDGTVKSVFGGATPAGLAENNTVNISGGTVNMGVCGGFSSNNKVTGNKVTISGGTINADGETPGVYGGYIYASIAEASKNSVTITKGTVNCNVYGGASDAGSANNNSVTVTGGSVGAIYGGSGGTKNAGGSSNNNTVTIGGGTVGGNVYGGYNEKGVATINNTVNLTGSTTGLENAEVYGGNLATYTGNELHVGGTKDGSVTSVWTGSSNNTVKKVANFETIALHSVKWDTTVAALEATTVTNIGTLDIKNLQFDKTPSSGESMALLKSASDLSAITLTYSGGTTPITADGVVIKGGSGEQTEETGVNGVKLTTKGGSEKVLLPDKNTIAYSFEAGTVKGITFGTFDISKDARNLSSSKFEERNTVDAKDLKFADTAILLSVNDSVILVSNASGMATAVANNTGKTVAIKDYEDAQKIKYSATATGDVTSDGAAVKYTVNSVEVNSVGLAGWSGTASAVPTGWKLAEGATVDTKDMTEPTAAATIITSGTDDFFKTATISGGKEYKETDFSEEDKGIMFAGKQEKGVKAEGNNLVYALGSKNVATATMTGEIKWDTEKAYYENTKYAFTDSSKTDISAVKFTATADPLNQSMTLIKNNVAGTVTESTPEFTVNLSNTSLSATAKGEAKVDEGNLTYKVTDVELKTVTVNGVGSTSDTVPNGWTAASGLTVDTSKMELPGVMPAAGEEVTILKGSDKITFDGASFSGDNTYGKNPDRFTEEDKAQGAVIIAGKQDKGVAAGADGKSLVYKVGTKDVSSVSLGAVKWASGATLLDASDGAYNFAGVTALEGSFAMNYEKPEDVAPEQYMTLLKANATLQDMAKEETNTWNYPDGYEPVAGVTMKGEIAGKLAAKDKAVTFTVESNKASELTFGKIEWTGDTALIDHSKTLTNISFDGATVDTSGIDFYKEMYIEADQTMTLVSNFGGEAKVTPESTKYMVGTAYEGESETKMEGDNLIIRTKTPAGLSEQTHKTVMAMEAGMALLASGGEHVGKALESLGDVANQDSDGTSIGVSIGGGGNRYETGSHVNVNSWNAALAIGAKRELKQGALEYGVFGEYGKGSYKLYNDDGGRGDGDAHYAGAGLMAKWTNKHDVYTEASFRLGRMSDSADNILEGGGNKYGYDVHANYYGAHVGVGKVFRYKGGKSLDVYGKYFYTKRDGVEYDAKQHYNLDAVASSVLRIGARYGSTDKLWNWYGGLAYEYEFDGEATGSVNGTAIRAASIKGSSVRGELGMKMSATKDNPWQADISIYGYGGKHRGFGGNVSVAYTF